jgi:hypothetical protein
MLRRIFRSKRIEVTGSSRKLNNEELHKLYSSPSIIKMIKSRKMIWTEHVALMGRRGKHEGKRPLRRPRRRWVNNMKMDLGEVG